MGKLADQLNTDLKKAMLSGDKELVSIIKGMKSALQYAAVEQGAGSELSEEQEVKVLQKESKKRADAAEIYAKANDKERTDKELHEKEVIDGYLPDLLSEEEVAKLVDEIVSAEGEVTPQNMGKIIAAVRQKSGGLAEGSIIARLVKERIGQ